jgi:hypothetical protein
MPQPNSLNIIWFFGFDFGGQMGIVLKKNYPYFEAQVLYFCGFYYFVSIAHQTYIDAQF